jgi:membrane protease YdiL (CAAX protease family)
VASDCRPTLADSPPHDYWELTRQPLPSLIFILPLLFLYEAGVAFLGEPGTVGLRNGADHWLRQGILSLGVQATFVLPSLMVMSLAAWHVYGKYRREFSLEAYAGMVAESLLFAILLIVIGQTQDLLSQRINFSDLMLSVSPQAGLAIGFIGAGLYEEFLFRLVLLSGLWAGLNACRIPSSWSLGLAVVASSVMFAGAHYIGPAGDTYTHFGFIFRLMAGFYFAGLFVFRGLGIAVGAHAVYDLIVGLSLSAQVQ